MILCCTCSSYKDCWRKCCGEDKEMMNEEDFNESVNMNKEIENNNIHSVNTINNNKANKYQEV
jgi:hypothetical protein